MKTIIVTLLIAICFSFFHCNEEKDNQPPIGRESLLACDFEVCPYELGASSRPVQIERKLINVRATVLAHYGGKSILVVKEGSYNALLVPCRPLDKKFIVDKKEVLISGYVLNCSGGLTLPQFFGTFGNLFELTYIKEFSSNTN